MQHTLQLISLFLSGLLLTACDVTTPEQYKQEANSDTTSIYLNADIVTMNEEQPSATAVVVTAGKIAEVGATDELLAKYSNARTVDLGGATLVPGFIDTHGHLNFSARYAASANVASPPVGPATTVADIITELKAFATQQPNAPWIIGMGYDDSLLVEKRHPNKLDLDLVSEQKPVAIIHVSGHLASCNSKCLELIGIDATTPNPSGGVIRRLKESREPNGVVEETAMYLIFKALPQPDLENQLAMLENAQSYYTREGITTIQDGAVQAAELKILKTAAAQNRFKLDVVAFPIVGAFAGENLNNINASQEYANRFRVGGIKLVLDGSPQGKTAWLTQPYLHAPHGQSAEYTGYPMTAPDTVTQTIDQAFALNLPVLAHANGDAAADLLINSVKAANKKHGNADRRTVMIHAQTVREDQIDEMVTENILPSYFSAHVFYWGDWHRDSVFGEARANRISPLKSSLSKGLLFTTHNDAPVVPPNMMRLMWASVNRVTRSGKVLGADQRISPYEALKSITLNAAYQYFEENDKGSIEVGKLADFTVLDKNPLLVDPMTIQDINVLQTIKGGVVIYDASKK